ncbi:MAG TPA: ABC transporter permease [Solirubrobacterales bacterium]
MLHPFITTSFWNSVILGAGPIAFAALGSLLCSRGGILFIGVEGTLLTSCFFSIAGVAWTGSPFVGVVFGLLAGSLAALVFGYLSMNLRMGDIVAGLVVQIAALGVCGFLLDELFPSGLTVGDHQLTAPWGRTGSKVVDVLLHQAPLIYLVPIVAVAIAMLLRSRWGLKVRASGESLQVAYSLGLPVARIRYLLLAAGGAIVGLGGAMLGLAVVGTFATEVTGGRGFIALACVVLAGWRPGWTVLFAVIFSAAYSYGLQVNSAQLGEWIQLLPYALTLVVMALFWGRRPGPAEEGRGLEVVDD